MNPDAFLDPLDEDKDAINTDASADLGSLSEPSEAVKLELQGSAAAAANNGGDVDPRLRDVRTPEMEGNDQDALGNGDSAEEWCAMCHDGGDTLYCCDRCPKVRALASNKRC